MVGYALEEIEIDSCLNPHSVHEFSSHEEIFTSVFSAMFYIAVYICHFYECLP